MRIQRQDDGWWIVDVPSLQDGGAGTSSCGPYPTKAAAVDDRRGLDRFFQEQGVPSSVDRPAAAPSRPAAEPPCGSGLNAAAPCPAAPPPRPRRRRFKPMPGQRLLPGFEAEPRLQEVESGMAWT